MTLTEQWKKGKLQNNWYYIRTTNGIEKWEYIKQSHGFGYYETEWVLEVLAPVPSYEEYSRLEWYAGCGPDRIVELAKENQQLKNLLKEIRGKLKYINTPKNRHNIFGNVMMVKIDEVLK